MLRPYARRLFPFVLLTIAAMPSNVSLEAATVALTIDAMDTGTFGNYEVDYRANDNRVIVLGKPDRFYVSDGSNWEAGAGSHPTPSADVVGQSLDGGTLHFTLEPNHPDGLLMDYTDYDSGNHSSKGQLAPYGPTVLEAEVGSTVGTISGYALIVSNPLSNYDPPSYKFYSASVGQAVPYVSTITLRDGATWQEGILATDFDYNIHGHVDFTQPIPEPSTLVLLLAGGGAMAMVYRRRKCR